MAVAEEKTSPGATEKSWHGVVLQTLKRNDIRLVPYVPDRVLTTLIRNLHADPFFTTFPTAREEEAVGIVSGAWMGNLTALEPYKPYAAAVALVFIGLGFRQVYFKPKGACAEDSYCARPQASRITKSALWLATVLVLLALTISWWAPLFY